MADAEVVATKLERIEQYHGELSDKQSLPKETFLTNVTQQRAVERMFENAIQACIDLAKHVATEDFDYEGNKSKEAVIILENNDVIDSETAATLTDAVGFRNILAHEYGEVRQVQVYNYLQNELDVYEAFSQQVATWFRERKT
jgi:uncharacterized protein YutE (UPF0331/DUF86 family)